MLNQLIEAEKVTIWLVDTNDTFSFQPL